MRRKDPTPERVRHSQRSPHSQSSSRTNRTSGSVKSERKRTNPQKNQQARTTMHHATRKRAGLTHTMFKSLHFYQTTTHLLIAKLPFSRLVREVVSIFGEYFRFQVAAIEALQSSAEHYLTDLFSDSNKMAHHARRVTIMPKDMQLVLNIRGPSDPGWH